MADVLIYSKDFVMHADALGQPRYWHSSAPVFGKLALGDRLWLVTSGQALKHEAERAGFLVAVWQVAQVQPNPGDEPDGPSH